MATCVWTIQYRELYGNLCLVYKAQRDVWQLVFGLYSTESCMATCFVYTAQRAVCQLVFGLYSTQLYGYQKCDLRNVHRVIRIVK